MNKCLKFNFLNFSSFKLFLKNNKLAINNYQFLKKESNYSIKITNKNFSSSHPHQFHQFVQKTSFLFQFERYNEVQKSIREVLNEDHLKEMSPVERTELLGIIKKLNIGLIYSNLGKEAINLCKNAAEIFEKAGLIEESYKVLLLLGMNYLKADKTEQSREILIKCFTHEVGKSEDNKDKEKLFLISLTILKVKFLELNVRDRSDFDMIINQFVDYSPENANLQVENLNEMIGDFYLDFMEGEKAIKHYSILNLKDLEEKDPLKAAEIYKKIALSYIPLKEKEYLLFNLNKAALILENYIKSKEGRVNNIFFFELAMLYDFMMWQYPDLQSDREVLDNLCRKILDNLSKGTEDLSYYFNLYYHLFHLRMLDEDTDKAIEYSELALKAAKEFRNREALLFHVSDITVIKITFSAIRNELIKVILDLVNLYRELDQVENAKRVAAEGHNLLRKVELTDPNFIESIAEMSKLNHELGNFLESANDFGDVLDVFLKQEEKDMLRISMAFYFKILSLIQQGEINLAKEDFNRLKKLIEENPEQEVPDKEILLEELETALNTN